MWRNTYLLYVAKYVFAICGETLICLTKYAFAICGDSAGRYTAWTGKGTGVAHAKGKTGGWICTLCRPSPL